MYTISKEFAFSASHALTHLPATHPCHNLHGHNYRLKINLASETLNQNGFVVDYRELGFVKEWVDRNLDHKHLNEMYECTTVEAMSRAIYDILKRHIPQLKSVELSETDKTNCIYEPS